VADQDRGETGPDRGETGSDRGQPGSDRGRPRSDRGRPRAEPRRARPDRSQPNPDRGQPRAEPRRARPEGRGRFDGAESGSDDLWPPFTGPGWLPDRASRAHRVLHDQRGRGRPRVSPTLSRAEIVDAAIAVADTEGSDAVSMRRIAQVLRAGTMSLYWHVANKEQLLDLMMDVLIGEFDVPEPSGDWREDLRTQARRERATLLRHAWVMDFLGGRPPLGPNTLLHLDRQLAALDGLGLDVAAAMNILGTVQTYVMGSVLREMQEARAQRDQDQADITHEEWEPARAAWRNRLADDGRFTRVVRFLDAGIDPDAPETRDDRFEFGLDCVIDGIAAKIAELSAGGSS
jgi:AcrR family transcriptional regulator